MNQRDFDETRLGTYKVPFTHIQYGAFVKEGGRWIFKTTGYTPDDAKRATIHYYEKMDKFPHNNMDMDALNDIQIRKREVTYGLWSEPLTDQ